MHLRGPLGLIFLLLASCSATQYQAPIDQFSDATKTAVTTTDGQLDAMVQARSGVLRQTLTNDATWTIVNDPSDCHDGSSGCAVEVGPVNGTKQPLTPSLHGTLVSLIHSLGDYAQGLHDIVHSDTAAQVNTSLAAAIGSITNLSDAVRTSDLSKAKTEQATADKAAEGKSTDSPEAKAAAAADKRVADLSATKAPVSEYTAPAGNIFSWLAGEYISHMQVESLKTATAKAEPLMKDAAAVLKATSQQLANPITSVARTKFEAARRAYDRRDIADRAAAKTATDNYIAAAANYNGVLLATNTNVFDAMTSAHTKLYEQLHGLNQITLADFSASVQIYATQVGALQKALASLPTR